MPKERGESVVTIKTDVGGNRGPSLINPTRIHTPAVTSYPGLSGIRTSK